MLQKIRKINSIQTISIVSKTLIFLNVASITLGILYLSLVLQTNINIFWDISGIVVWVTIFGNILLIYLNDVRLNKNTRLGNQLNLFSYFYLIFICIGMILIPLYNWQISDTSSNSILDNLGFFFIVMVFTFGFYAFGLIIGIIDLKNIDNRELWKINPEVTPNLINKALKSRQIIKVILEILCLISLCTCIILVYGTFFAIYAGLWFFGFFPLFSLSIAFISINSTLILLKLLKKKRHTKISRTIGLIGIITTSLLMVPLFTTPYNYYNAENNFSDAFGTDWKDKIDPQVEEKYFMKSPYSSLGYFFGIPSRDYNYQTDVLYFKGSNSEYEQDQDIKLYFNVYWPKEQDQDLPGVNNNGKSAILIRIHGGSWRYGDKGQEMQVNKYYAAQGYVVYDIQYGLNDEARPEGVLLESSTPEYVRGDFDVNDMIRHIGNFTQYIADSSNAYSAKKLNADLDLVLVSGGSAGGHLCCTTALGIYSEDYVEYFGDKLTIIGYIPFYPGNGYSGLDGKKTFKNPENYLVDKNAPPCLIYDGTSDPTVEIAKHIKEEYTENGNDKCCIIWFQLAGHSNDLYFSGYYNQPFVYFMERFCYLCVEGEI